MKYTPAIVVAAYNRPKSLKRILASLLYAKNITDVPLIISIDNNAPHNLNIKEIADAFQWPFGEKKVIFQDEHLGLRKHIIKCGDLSEKYGSVIILEDDLFVSPFFYDYAVKALEYYESDEAIGGISLFSEPREEISEFPFVPLEDDSDVYFMQFPSSWGQAWSNKHWTGFRKWLQINPVIPTDIAISPFIVNWPQTSWKKFFVAYLIQQNKFFVFPRVSLTTNFNDAGTHYKLAVNNDGQAPLRIIDKSYLFKKLEDSYCVYDAFFELMVSKYKALPEKLKEYNFEMDLYGNKTKETIKAPFVITSKRTHHPILSYRRSFKPQVLNIILELEGDVFHLCKKEDILMEGKSIQKSISDYNYFYSRYFSSLRVSLYNTLSKKKWLSFLFN